MKTCNRIKKNKGPASRRQANASRGGFVILFAVMLSGIVLTITLGILNISYKEIKFSTSARDTNNAFFAADAGAECALYYDKSTENFFSDMPVAEKPMICNLKDIVLIPNNDVWSFVVADLGVEKKGCAFVTVDKRRDETTIISKGYSDAIGDESSCTPAQNSVERQLELSY